MLKLRARAFMADRCSYYKSLRKNTFNVFMGENKAGVAET